MKIKYPVVLLLIISTFGSLCRADLDSLLVSVTAEEIKNNSAPSMENKIVLDKPVTVEKSTNYLTIQDLLPALKYEIEKRYQINGNLRIFPLRSWNGVALQSTVWKLEITKAPSLSLSSKVLVGFQLTSEGKTIGEWQIPLRCEIWSDVLVTRQLLNRGSAVSKRDFEVKNMDVLRFPNTLVDTGLDLLEYELVQTVSEGQPLLLRDIAAKPLIRKGQVVEVVASEGQMYISMKGQALEDGIRDAFISIRNINSRKNIQAQVIDDSKVKVYF